MLKIKIILTDTVYHTHLIVLNVHKMQLIHVHVQTITHTKSTENVE